MDDGVIEDAVDVETDLNDGHLTRLYTCYPGLPTKTGLILEKKNSYIFTQRKNQIIHNVKVKTG